MKNKNQKTSKESNKTGNNTDSKFLKVSQNWGTKVQNGS